MKNVLHTLAYVCLLAAFWAVLLGIWDYQGNRTQWLWTSSIAALAAFVFAAVRASKADKDDLTR